MVPSDDFHSSTISESFSSVTPFDALKKSESERQQKGSAEFTGVPTSSGRQSAPRWLWILGVLLAVNLAVLLGLLFRPDAEPPVTPAAIEPVAVNNDAFAEQVAEAKQNVPLRDEPRPVVVDSPRATTPPPEEPVSRRSTNTATLPTIHEVIANGTVTLPDLHVDIHVYSESARDRFVFINMDKHNEGSKLAEGPVVEEITPDGVVLRHNGASFLLPRD